MANPRRAFLPHWLIHMGGPGLFTVAIIDSTVIPLPLPGSTDLLLLWLVAHGKSPWLFAPVAIVGSLLGGYITWHLGRKGGEATLHRYVRARLLERIVAWVEDHPILSVFLPAILPPPIPLSPFVIASGALGVSRARFLTAFCAARALRYSFTAWLGMVYGQRIIQLWTVTLHKWSTPLLWLFAALLAGGLYMGLRKAHRITRSDTTAPRDETAS